jgi:hypothetical protein
MLARLAGRPCELQGGVCYALHVAGRDAYYDDVNAQTIRRISIDRGAEDAHHGVGRC